MVRFGTDILVSRIVRNLVILSKLTEFIRFGSIQNSVIIGFQVLNRKYPILIFLTKYPKFFGYFRILSVIRLLSDLSDFRL